MDQFVRRGYLKERFADGGPEKRLPLAKLRYP